MGINVNIRYRRFLTPLLGKRIRYKNVWNSIEYCGVLLEIEDNFFVVRHDGDSTPVWCYYTEIVPGSLIDIQKDLTPDRSEGEVPMLQGMQTVLETHAANKVRSKKRKYIYVAVLIVAGLVIGLGTHVLSSYLADRSASTMDSGVAACSQMVDNGKNSAKTDSGGAKKMSEAQYKEKRAPFEHSKYSDIRVAGTNIIDTIYKMDKEGQELDLGSSLALLTVMQNQWSQLQVACLNHGVEIPSLTSAS